MKVKEINEMDRPREKAVKYGLTQLSSSELLAILLRSGTKGKNAIELASEVLSLRQYLTQLSTVTLNELMQIKGIKEAKALEILACFELSKRMVFEKVDRKTVIRNPKALINWLNAQIGYLDREHFMVIFLNHRNEILSHREMFVGGSSHCAVSLREVFTFALRIDACRILLVHNHPTGNVLPSQEDIETTKNIIEAGRICGIDCLDHIIVGHNDYFSFKEKQMIAS